MLKFINNLPEELIHKIKEYVLSKEVLLKLFYQKHKLNEQTLKKKLSCFTSKQLEQINWKYLYYKIYKTSPPRYDNKNFVSVFSEIKNPQCKSIVDDDYYEPLVIFNPRGEIFHYRLNSITRSDYYPEHTDSEKERKKQQYNNIIDGWKFIHEGNIRTSTKPTEYPITKNMYNYLLNMEYELVRAIFVMAKLNNDK